MDERQSILSDYRISLYGRLFEAWASVTRLLDGQLDREVGIPLIWYAVLLRLGRSEEGMRPIGELGLATAFTSGGVTRLVDRMEVAGYVKRQRCPTDRRVIYVALTEAGSDLLHRATAIHLKGIQAHIVDNLRADEVDQLTALLTKLVSGQDPSSTCSQ